MVGQSPQASVPLTGPDHTFSLRVSPSGEVVANVGGEELNANYAPRNRLYAGVWGHGEDTLVQNLRIVRSDCPVGTSWRAEQLDIGTGLSEPALAHWENRWWLAYVTASGTLELREANGDANTIPESFGAPANVAGTQNGRLSSPTFSIFEGQLFLTFRQNPSDNSASTLLRVKPDALSETAEELDVEIGDGAFSVTAVTIGSREYHFIATLDESGQLNVFEQTSDAPAFVKLDVGRDLLLDDDVGARPSSFLRASAQVAGRIDLFAIEGSHYELRVPQQSGARWSQYVYTSYNLVGWRSSGQETLVTAPRLDRLGTRGASRAVGAEEEVVVFEVAQNGSLGIAQR